MTNMSCSVKFVIWLSRSNVQTIVTQLTIVIKKSLYIDHGKMWTQTKSNVWLQTSICHFKNSSSPHFANINTFTVSTRLLAVFPKCSGCTGNVAGRPREPLLTPDSTDSIGALAAAESQMEHHGGNIKWSLD